MGCFNVSCSISNLSISSGTEVAFIPLHPANSNRKGQHLVRVGNSILYPNTYFNPLTLPIFGKYNDYGDIEDIVENENTRAIEAYFGLEIQEFVSLINCGRPSVNDKFSDFFSTFATHKELLKDYKIPFDAQFLTAFGLVGTEVEGETQYTFGDLPFVVLLKEDSEDRVGYEIKNTKGNVLKVETGYDAQKQFLDDFYEVTGYHLNVSKENQWKVSLLLRVSGMFVHKEIYDELAGTGSNKMKAAYDELQVSIEKSKESKGKMKLKEGLSQEQIDEVEELMELLSGNPFSYSNRDRNPLLSFFRNWKVFNHIYDTPLTRGEMKEDTVRYIQFYNSIFSCNRFLFPAMSGEQHGNLAASMKLLEKSMEIVNKEIKALEDEDIYID